MIATAVPILAALLLAAASAEAAEAVIEGSVLYRERMALPPNAVVEIRLLDVSKMDVAAEVIAETRITPETQVPIRFALEYDPAKIDQRYSYSVQARILVDGRLWFISTQSNPVLTRGHPDEVEILVERVAGRSDRSDFEEFEERVARIDGGLAAAERIEGSYAVGEHRVSYVAVVDGALPLVVTERMELAEGGSREVILHFADGDLLRYRSYSHTYSNAGAPSDGWYDRAMTIYFEPGRFAGGSGTINGRLAEPDEHEVRAAYREAEAVKARIAARRDNPE